MSVNNARAAELIAKALTNNGWITGGNEGTLQKAFRELQAVRQAPGGSVDLDYAAAEHYMFARWMVARGAVSATQMKIITTGYDLKKALEKWLGVPNASAVTANPVSKPDADVVIWGLMGADHGAVDRVTFGNAAPPMWVPVNDILGKPVGGKLGKIGY